MKKVLIISFRFPLWEDHISSVRLKGLANYLPRFGWKPTLLTPELPNEIQAKYNEFRVMQSHYPGDVSFFIAERFGLNPNQRLEDQVVPFVVRGSRNIVAKKIRDWFFGFIAYPDQEKHWRTYAIRTGEEILAHESFDAILSSFLYSEPGCCIHLAQVGNHVLTGTIDCSSRFD